MIWKAFSDKGKEEKDRESDRLTKFLKSVILKIYF